MQFHPPVRLPGRHLELVPLALEQVGPLLKAANAPEIWTYWRDGPLVEREAMERFVKDLLARQERGTDLPFAVVRREDGAPVGMTRFLDIQREYQTVEVGGTWFSRSLWGSMFNRESKRLMLGYAFDTEGCHRVQLKADQRNLRSLRAIERLGAVREGVLREHVVNADGHRRSSVYYSILAAEWPKVRALLDAALDQPDPLARAAE